MSSYASCTFAAKIKYMPTNKNALIRYKYLDRLLSDHHHYYDIHDLTEKVNDMLYNDGFPEVTQRCIEKDLNTLEYAPFSAPIERFKKNGKNCITYGKYSFSIFKEEMSREERSLLREVLGTLGQFEGLAHFEWLEKFKIGLGLDDTQKVICFSNNPYLKNSSMLAELFDVTANKQVVELTYHKFNDEQRRSVIIHPYQLKQYNNRWYLLCSPDDNPNIILNFAIDRLDKVQALPEMKFRECSENLSEHFDDIVGVSLYKDRPIEHILCWVSDYSKGYIDTKPIHASQTHIRGDAELQLRSQYPHLQGGMFFTLNCISNKELIRELTSYGKDLLVLHSDGSIKDDVYKRVCEMREEYSKLRT